MPDEEKTVDIDTTGPGADVEIKEDKEEELKPVEETVKETEEKVHEPRTTEQEPEVKAEEKPEEKTEEKTEEKPELEQYSEGVQKRIAKLTKKWREAERQKEAAIDYAKGVQHEHSQLKTRFSKMEPNYVKALENRVASGMDAAKAKLTTAREAGDINAEVEAQKSIAQLGIEEVRLNALKDRQSQEKEQEVKTPTLQDTVGRTPPPDPKAEEWASKNEWFGKDNAMTYTAFDYHKKLTEQEGFDPNSTEYYAEIDKRMRLDFPHKFDNTKSQESTNRTQIVASAKRSVHPGRKTVRLTSSQVAIAKKLGVPLEEYAKQLKITKEA
jgi:soluble cytochrome b562